MANALREAGLPFQQQYPACGFFLDFALFREDFKLNVEVDGETHHRTGSGARRLSDIYRDQILKATQWTVVRFWVKELREDMDSCIDKIRSIYQKGKNS
jgi:very-short-patch-repair endonuclease